MTMPRAIAHAESGLDNLRSAWYRMKGTRTIEDYESILQYLNGAMHQITLAERDLVHAARADGLTWGEIGAALNIHESTARLRYKR